MNKIAKHIAGLLIDNKVIMQADKDIYIYGIELFLISVLEITAVLWMSIIVGNFFETALFLMAFLPIRIYSGGYHADTRLKCFFILIGVYFLFTVCIKGFPWQKYENMAIAGVISTITVVALFAPLRNRNKKLNNCEQRNYKIISVCLTAAEGAIVIILGLCNCFNVFYKSISIGLFTVMISLITGKIKNIIIERGAKNGKGKEIN